MRRLGIIPACCAVLLTAAGTPCFLFPQSPNQQSSTVPQGATNVSASMDDAVAAYRKIIVLMDGASLLDEGNRERVRTVAWILFVKNQERLEKLEEDLRAGLAKNDATAIEEFLQRLETNPEYRDADKLVFRDLLDGLAAQAQQGNAPASIQKRIADDLAALEKIQALYQKEIPQIFAGLRTRGMTVHREAWEHYLAFLKTKYQRERILKEYEDQLPPVESRGGAARKSGLEIFGTEMPRKTLALTFDDGPHPRYTDQVLAILKKYGLQAVFFEVGKNLGTVSGHNEIRLGAASAASYRVLESGSGIGNHSYSHPVLPKLNEAAYTKEIESTSALLTYIAKRAPALFRPPYGAINNQILKKVQSDKMKTVMWNVDSEDWADPVPNSVAQRVLTEVEEQGRGIILFHDIHKVGLEALPGVIETLQADGYKFVSWNGAAFAFPGAQGSPTVAAAPPPSVPPYRESWAAIIAVDDYATWPQLRYAAHDALGVKDVLIQKYNFKPDHIFTLLNKEASRQNIMSLLGDKLADPNLVQREDRVLVFYAGHGATRKLASGRELGYIIPVDADLSNYAGSAISMTNFQDISEAIAAKHVLFIMDSCYSGLGLTRGGSLLLPQNYLSEMARREARQMLTAGGADQQVADSGPNGYSVFTWILLQGLDGRGDLNGDGVITATELAAYVAPAVSALSHQTPAFGSLPGSEGGDFMFDPKHETEFLNQDSAQLGQDAIKLNAELEELRAQIREESRKNEELRKQLEAAQAQLKQGAPSAAPAAGAAATAAASPAPLAPPVDAPAALNDEGMRLYKEKRYTEAAAKFVEASKAKPASALFANNAGFAYFRMGQYQEAAKWFQQAISVDPKRAIAYLNLGDTYQEMHRISEAKSAYQEFLALAPNSKSAPAVRDKLNALP
jgi:peptidoglycan/xylan/chitin deacetylase (PgdA/CDA1 family)/uncharacterized caspase-like protein